MGIKLGTYYCSCWKLTYMPPSEAMQFESNIFASSDLTYHFYCGDLLAMPLATGHSQASKIKFMKLELPLISEYVGLFL